VQAGEESKHVVQTVFEARDDTGKCEDQYLDGPPNVDLSLGDVQRQQGKVGAREARDALRALVHAYQAESRNRAVPDAELKPLAQAADLNVKAMCDWRLGRETMQNAQGQRVGEGVTPKTLDEIIACLKRIRRSVENWHKRGGRRGYFDFVGEYVR